MIGSRPYKEPVLDREYEDLPQIHCGENFSSKPTIAKIPD
jgi:hypothetical protein